MSTSEQRRKSPEFIANDICMWWSDLHKSMKPQVPTLNLLHERIRAALATVAAPQGKCESHHTMGCTTDYCTLTKGHIGPHWGKIANWPPEQQAAAPPKHEEGRTWKGVRYVDSVRASTLAEEIALHFGHDCHDSMCTEDSDESDCEMAWVEDKLQELLELAASPASGEGQ